MNHSNVVTIKTEAARNEYLRSCPAAELSNEDLLDAQRATAADIEKDQTDVTLRERYNDLATEYGVRHDRGEQLVDAETVGRREADMNWFFDTDAVSIDDEDFQAYITDDVTISPAEGVAMILYRPVSLASCDELPIFLHLIERRLSGMENDEDGYEFLVERLRALRAADVGRHGATEPYEPDQAEVDSWLYFDTSPEDVYSFTPAGVFGYGVYAEVSNIVGFTADNCFGVHGTKWIEEIIAEQIKRIAAEVTPDLTTRMLEDIFKDGMRRAEADFDAISDAVHDYADKHDLPHV